MCVRPGWSWTLSWKTLDIYGDFACWLSFKGNYNLRSRSSHIPGALFKYLYHGWGSNDIRELRKFSTQLDMLIETPWFKGKVHIGADGGTMHDGWLRSVSLPGYTLMTSFCFFLPSLFPPGLSPWCRGCAALGRVDIIANFHFSTVNFRFDACIITFVY